MKPILVTFFVLSVGLGAIDARPEPDGNNSGGGNNTSGGGGGGGGGGGLFGHGGLFGRGGLFEVGGTFGGGGLFGGFLAGLFGKEPLCLGVNIFCTQHSECCNRNCSKLNIF